MHNSTSSSSKCSLRRKFLNVDLQNSIINLKSVLLQIRPIPRRTAHGGLVLYENGLFSYILVEKSATVGTVWFFQYHNLFKKGDYLQLNKIPEGFSIYNLELKLGYGGQIARSAGTSVKVLNRYPNKFYRLLLKYRSGEQYFVNANCCAMLGVCSNIDHWHLNYGSAGKKRLFGFRSTVRGVAMNPVDHPHGGNTNGGKPCMTPKGLLTKGVKTRKKTICKNVIFKRSGKRIDSFNKVKKNYIFNKKNE